MYIPPPPGAFQAVQDGGGGVRGVQEDEPSTFATVVKWGLIVGGIWGIAATVRESQRTVSSLEGLTREVNFFRATRG